LELEKGFFFSSVERQREERRTPLQNREAREGKKKNKLGFAPPSQKRSGSTKREGKRKKASSPIMRTDVEGCDRERKKKKRGARNTCRLPPEGKKKSIKRNRKISVP